MISAVSKTNITFLIYIWYAYYKSNIIIKYIYRYLWYELGHMISKQVEHKKVVDETRNTFNTFTRDRSNEVGGIKNSDGNTTQIEMHATSDNVCSKKVIKGNKYVVDVVNVINDEIDSGSEMAML